MELRHTEVKDIEGCSYEITQLGAIKGSAVFVRVLKMLGPALATGNVGSLLGALDEADVKYLVDAFAPLTNVPGQGQLDKIFDLHFAGRYKALVQWLLACLQVNYGEFLQGKVGSLAGALGAAGLGPSASSSPPMRTPGSTAS